MDLGRRHNLEEKTWEASTHNLAVGAAVGASSIAYVLLPFISARAAASPLVVALLPRLSTGCINDVDQPQLDHAAGRIAKRWRHFLDESLIERGWVGRGKPGRFLRSRVGPVAGLGASESQAAAALVTSECFGHVGRDRAHSGPGGSRGPRGGVRHHRGVGASYLVGAASRLASHPYRGRCVDRSFCPGSYGLSEPTLPSPGYSPGSRDLPSGRRRRGARATATRVTLGWRFCPIRRADSS
jgi:hypothetical protein